MAGKRAFGNPVPVSDLATAILDPVLKKRAGISIGLVQSWEEIAGPRLASHSRPEKIQWPRRLHEDDPFEPATLIIACEGMAALHLQHEAGEVINRVNAFLGFNAVGRIKILQKPVLSQKARPKPAPLPLNEVEKSKLSHLVGKIEDDGLRASLERLGATIMGERKRKGSQEAS
ncbi:DUF721 domain-containing protein [Mesorhizobium sp. B2-7-1]|uniref:DUF721 domain-containing protein n=2 Tax=unclassified Mesorhizobium TaxID=325217 RepID=UPI001125D9B5|nr:DUF721 domain-containing protein [Mesorhizobium sp. B2-7-1]TPJ57697.1 DUF721 domain-containing protein [Mesorhizobium sp. B2-7-1]